MKFYSETLNKLFNTEKELKEAEIAREAEIAKKEAAEKAKKTARALRAKEVEKALKVANDAQANAAKLLKEFTKDYGYFHTSYSANDEETAETIVSEFLNTVQAFLGE